MIQVLGASAVRIGLVDTPKGRKIHDGAVPLTGGIAIFAAFLVPVVYLHFQFDIHWGLVFGLLVLVVLGVADDAFDLKPGLKLAGQTGAALIMVLTNGALIGPGGLIGMPNLDSVGVALAFTLLFIVGVINAFNMIDGLDGLAGGTAAGALFWIIVATFIAGPAGAVVEPLLVLCAVLGFLLFNIRHPWRKRAVVFMGDAGSMMLGGAIAFFTLAAHKTPNGPPIAALLWCFALPVFDTLLLIARRLAAGASPLVGDRRHLHHLLLDSGLVSETAAAGIILLISFVLGGVGLLGWQLGASPAALVLGLLVPFAFHAYFVCHGWKALRPRPAVSAADKDRGNAVAMGPASASSFAMEAFKGAEDRR